MSATDRESLAPGESEQTLAVLHRHARVLLIPGLILIAASAAAGYFGGRLALPFLGQWTAPVFVGLGLIIFLCAFVSWRTKRQIVTTRRLISERGVFIRRRQEVLHSRGFEMTLRQNPFQRLYGSGTIEIDIGSPNRVKLTDIPHANLVFEALHDLSESSLELVRRSVSP